mmetsp:Transcript_17008/g.43690  ORF Transcript_17008/g.43690 Transcript_17008/m.43690 type:complete len:108 (+) Transcript_17008:325-648(+)
MALLQQLRRVGRAAKRALWATIGEESRFAVSLSPELEQLEWHCGSSCCAPMSLCAVGQLWELDIVPALEREIKLPFCVPPPTSRSHILTLQFFSLRAELWEILRRRS